MPNLLLSESEKLAMRFRKMAAEGGLVDIRFYLKNVDEAATEQVCQEVNRLYRAADEVRIAPLNFKDSYKGDQHDRADRS